jgi:hypothetical protein
LNPNLAQAAPQANNKEKQGFHKDSLLHQQSSEQYLSLVIRIWWGGREGQDPSKAWRSEVEHIQSGERWNFSDPAELERFLGRFLKVEK